MKKIYIAACILSLFFFIGCNKTDTFNIIHKILHIYPNVENDDTGVDDKSKETDMDIIEDIIEDTFDIVEDVTLNLLTKNNEGKDEKEDKQI